MSSTLFLYIFVAALLLYMATRVYLARRQMAHVQAHRAAVPARFAERIALTAHQKAADYTLAKTRFGLIEELFSMVVLVLLTLFGGIQILADATRSLTGGGLVYQMMLVVAVMALTSLVSLPFSLYRQFKLEEHFGFNKMTLGLYFADMVKGALVGAAIGLPLLAAVLWLMGAAGPAWWLYAWLLWMGFNLLILVLYPTVIAPLFNKFEPLSDLNLKSRIDALLSRCGFASKGVFVMDGSKRSAHGNAYFTGFGAAKRIVFFDTLLTRLNPDEIEAVLAHELGHFKHKHVIKRIVWTFAMSLAGLALLGWLADQTWFYHGLGVEPSLTARNDGLALILFFFVLPIFTFLFSPLQSLSSRKHEFEADAFAASQTRADDLVNALVKLYEDNASTLTPDPLHSAFYDSHPPAALRIARLDASKLTSSPVSAGKLGLHSA
jgi:STE24 endopeptidase